MIIYHNGKVEIVNNIKDCLDLLEPEIVEAIQYYNENGEILDLQEKYEDLESEYINYEESNQQYRNTLQEVQELAEELKSRIEEAKKLNRETIIYDLKEIINKIVMEL